jgi:hypothetical protein
MAKQLTEQQIQVTDFLLEGKTPTEIASDVDVSVESVKKWLTGDALFVATLNARRREQWTADSERLRGLAGKAIDALDQLVEHYNPSIQLRAATTILRTVSLAQVEVPDTKVTIDDVERDWREIEKWRELAALF